MVVLIDIDIFTLLINSHSVYAISKECVVKYDKNVYANLANIGTLLKNLRNTISRDI